MFRILVVDDAKEDRDLMTAILRTNSEYQVSEAVDGKDGLAVALRTHPDLIIADIKMPYRDGYQLVKDIRHHPSIANAEVVYYSGLFSDKTEGLKAIASSGVKRILIKPIEAVQTLA